MLYQGYQVPPFYDSLLGKLIVWDETREGAIARMTRALDELDVQGLSTTKPLHQLLAADENVRKAEFHTRWLEPWLEANAHRLKDIREDGAVHEDAVFLRGRRAHFRRVRRGNVARRLLQIAVHGDGGQEGEDQGRDGDLPGQRLACR